MTSPQDRSASGRPEAPQQAALPLNGEDGGVRTLPEGVISDQEVAEAGGEFTPPDPDAIGRTMFDTPASDDNTVTVVLPQKRLDQTPIGSLVRIRSLDKRSYLGGIVEGPFAEPDGLRADAPIVVASAVSGTMFVPRFHGRAQVELLGEEQDGSLVPPQYRPKPNSPVYLVGDDETAKVLNVGGDLRLGLAVGHAGLAVGLPSDSKNGLPRHLGILGTTGGGKSTTVAGLLDRLRAAGWATVLLDTEGEYTRINQPTESDAMRRRLEKQGRAPTGIEGTVVYHLVGRETANPDHPRVRAFSPRFSDLSPHAVVEVLDLSDPQQERFFQAYDVAKLILADIGAFPRRNNDEDERRRLDIDELETGYPEMRLGFLHDIAGAALALAAKTLDAWTPRTFSSDKAVVDAIKARVNTGITATGRGANENSWRALMGKLGRLNRLRIFDNAGAKPLDYNLLLTPGRVSVIDLSDTDAPQVNNLVIAEVLRGVRERQDEAYAEAKKEGRQPVPVAVVIEEAHEFLSRERIEQMPALFQQVARMARRGRKRWLGLVFVTQLPQHLPDEVLGLINSYILHKLNDANVISRLRRSIGGVDEALWDRLPGLAPGQAVVSLSTMARPMLVTIDPAPCRLGFEG